MRIAVFLFFFALSASVALALIDIQIPNPLPASPASAPGSLENQDTFQFSQVSLTGTIGDTGVSAQQVGTAGGRVRPCEWDYIKFDATTFSDYQVGDYMNIRGTATNTYIQDSSDNPEPIPGTVWLYVLYSAEGDNLPDEDNFDWKVELECPGCVGGVGDLDAFLPQTVIELLPCETHNTGAYWFGVQYVPANTNANFDNGNDPISVDYTVTVARRRVLGHCSGINLGDCDTRIDTIPVSNFGEDVQVIVVNETRPAFSHSNGFWLDDDAVCDPAIPADASDETIRTWQTQDQIRNWRFFRVDVPRDQYYRTSDGATKGSEGSYLRINITDIRRDRESSRDLSDVQLKVNYGALPSISRSTVGGTQLNQVDMDDNDVYSADHCDYWGSDDNCVSVDELVNIWDRDSTTSCECDPAQSYCWSDSDDEYHTCSVTVSPCAFMYGTYYVSVYIPNTNDCNTDEDDPDYTAFKLSAHFIRPSDYDNVIALEGNGMMGSTTGAYIDLAQDAHFTHYYFDVDESERWRNFELVAENVQGGSITVHLRGPDYDSAQMTDGRLAGFDCDGEYCRQQWSMNACRRNSIEIPYCDFEPGRYYVAVAPSSFSADPLQGSNQPYSPIEYQLYWRTYDEENAAAIYAGAPVFGSLASGQNYAFYVLSVSDIGDDASLYLELYQDYAREELSVSISKEGNVDQCSDVSPHFSCNTKSGSDYPSDGGCYYVLDACELTNGPLYITVKRENTGSSQDTAPIEFTLWAAFEYPMTLQNNVTYSDVVRTGQYNHYVFHAESVVQGSWFTVSINNVNTQSYNGDEPVIDSFINYGAMAGTCPCYDSLFNCTGGVKISECGDVAECGYDYLDAHHNLDFWYHDQGVDNVYADDYDCCKHHIDACTFRSGSWYVSVLGAFDGYSNYKESKLPFDNSDDEVATAISYTITATIHPAPPVFTIPMNENLVDWVDEKELNHYLLLGSYVPGHRLVVRLVWAQENCDRFDNYYSAQGEYPHQNDSEDFLQVRLAVGNLALPECYERPWSCEAHRDSYSECTMVIPECEWKELSARGNLFVSVYGDHTDDKAQFTIRAEAEPVETHELAWDTPTYGSTLADRYVHYWFDVTPQTVTEDNTLTIDLYYHRQTVNNEWASGEQRSNLEFSLRVGGTAGVARSDDKYPEECGLDCGKAADFVCTNVDSCHWELEACDLERLGWGMYHLSVYSPDYDFAVLPLEYTLTIGTRESTTQVFAGPENRMRDWAWGATVANGNSQANMNDGTAGFATTPYRHYRYTHEEETTPDQWLEIRVGALDNADVTIYFSRSSKAGTCPCYANEYFIRCQENSECPSGPNSGLDQHRTDNVEFCTITVPPCQFAAGVYNLAVVPNGDHDGIVQWTVEVIVHGAAIVDGLSGITNTDSNGAVVHFGITPGFQYESDYHDTDEVETYNQFFSWNANNIMNNQVLDNGEWAYYQISRTADSNALISLFIDNVRSERCWSGDEVPVSISTYVQTSGYYYDYSEDCAFDCETNAIVGPLTTGPDDLTHVQLNCPGSVFYLSIQADTATDFGTSETHLEYTSGYNHVTFDLKALEQLPVTLAEGRREFNVTHPMGGKQRFRLDNVDSTGLAPLMQFALENIWSGSINSVRFYPTSQDPCDDCYQDECVEARPALPFQNNRLDLTTNGALGPDLEDNYSDCDFDMFDANYPSAFQCRAGGNEQCMWSLLPCALKSQGEATSTSWIVEVDASVGAFYQVWWQNTDTSASSVVAIPSSYIASRTIYPFADRDEEDTRDPINMINMEEMDQISVFSFEVDGIDAALGDVVGATNGTSIPNRQFTRLEVQIYKELPTDDNNNSYNDVSIPLYVTIRRAEDGEPVAIFPIGEDDLDTHDFMNSNPDCSGCSSSVAYICGGTGSCIGGDRMYVPSCVLRDGTYHIVVRQTQPGRKAVGFRVRLVEQKEDGVVLAQPISAASLNSGEVTPIFEVDQDNLAYMQVSRDSWTEDGLEPGNFHHYVVDMSDESLFLDYSTTPPTERSLTMVLSNDWFSDTTPSGMVDTPSIGTLFLTARFDNLAGWSPSSSHGTYSGVPVDSINALGASGYGSSNSKDDCFSFTFSCRLDDENDENERCAFEIPARHLKAGLFFFSVYHDHWQSTPANPLQGDETEVHWAFSNHRGYNITAFFRDNVADTTQKVTGDGASNGFCLTDRQGYDYSSFRSSNTFTVGDVNQEIDFVSSIYFDAPSIINGGIASADATQNNLGFRAFYAFEVTQAAIEAGCTGNPYCHMEKVLWVSVRNNLIDDADADLDDRTVGMYNNNIRASLMVPQTAWRRGAPRELASYAGFLNQYSTGQWAEQGNTASSSPIGDRMWSYYSYDTLTAAPIEISSSAVMDALDFCGDDGYESFISIGRCNYKSYSGSQDTDFADYANANSVNGRSDLRAGWYYVTIETDGYNEYSICAELEHTVYESQARTSFADPIRGEQVTQIIKEVYSDNDGTDDTTHEWHYTFEILDSDVASQLNHLQINWTSINTGGANLDDIMRIRLWNQDCLVWSIDDFDSGYIVEVDPDIVDFPFPSQDFRAVFDHAGLSLCSLEPGRYWLDIERNVDCDEVNDEFNVDSYPLYDFDLNVLLRTANEFELAFDEPVQSTIYNHQYHVYKVTVPDSAAGVAIMFNVYDVTCGDVEVFAKERSPAGPTGPGEDAYWVGNLGSYANDPEDEPSSSCDSCNVATCDTNGDDRCNIQLAPCDTHPNSDGETVWYFTVHGIGQTYYYSDVHSVPAAYKVSVSMETVAVHPVSGLHCEHMIPTSAVDDTLDCDGQLELGTADGENQIVFEVDSVPFGAKYVLTRTGGNTNNYLSFEGPVGEWYSYGSGNGVECDSTSFSNEYSFDAFDVGCSPFSIWVYGNAKYTLSRHEPYTPTIYPGEFIIGSVFEDKFDGQGYPMVVSTTQYYRMPSYDVDDASAFFFRLVVDYVHNGEVNFGVHHSNTGHCSIGNGPSYAVSSDMDFPRQYAIYRSCQSFACIGGEIIAVSYANSDCDGVCHQVEYAFNYVYGDELTDLTCDEPMCDSASAYETYVPRPGNDLSHYKHYHLSPSASLDPNSVRVEDEVYEAEMLTIKVWESEMDFEYHFSDNGLFTSTANDITSYCNIASGSSCDSNNVEQSYSASMSTVCAFKDAYFSMDFNSISIDDIDDDTIHYRIGRYCDPVEVTDITSALNNNALYAISGECGVADDGRTYYSFVPSFEGELTYLEVASSNANWYLNVDGLADSGCTIEESDGDGLRDIMCDWQMYQGEVWYLTVDPTEDEWSLVLTVRGNANGFPNTELALGESTGHIDIPMFPGTSWYHLFYVDVATPAADEYLTFHLSHSGHVSLGGWAGMMYSSTNQDDDDCYFNGGRYISRDLAIQSWDEESISTWQNPVVIDLCDFTEEGRYFFVVQNRGTAGHNTMRVTAEVMSHNLNIGTLTTGTALSDSVLNAFWSKRQNSVNVYEFSKTGSVASARVFNVVGGEVTLSVRGGAPYVDEFYPSSPLNQVEEDSSNSCMRRSCDSNYGFDYSNTVQEPNSVGCTSCEVWLDSCYFSHSDSWYVTITTSQSFNHRAVTYEVIVDQWDEYPRLAYNTESELATFSSSDAAPREVRGDGHWQSFIYKVDTDRTLASLVLEINYESEFPQDTISVKIRTNSDCVACDDDIDFVCTAGQPAWMCRFDIPTRADVYDNQQAEVFYVQVKGAYGSFSMHYTSGMDNCVDPTPALSFCSGAVSSAPVWNVKDLAALDSEASCYYDNLVTFFENPEAADCGYINCSWGITRECEEALRAYSCQRSFRSCDANGFISGVPVMYCSDVADKCGVAWNSVGMANLACDAGYYQ